MNGSSRFNVDSEIMGRAMDLMDLSMHIQPRGRGIGGNDALERPQLMDVLVDLRRTMEALDEARVRVASILNLPDPTPLHDPFLHDYLDSHLIAKIRRKNRTMLDDAIAKCLIS